MTSTWNGRRATKATAYVIERDGGVCHLCGHDGATSLDHIEPTTIRPELEWDPNPWRAAHLYGAGHTKGCAVPGCHCPGNQGRNNAPAELTRRVIAELNTDVDTAPPSRDW